MEIALYPQCIGQVRQEQGNSELGKAGAGRGLQGQGWDGQRQGGAEAHDAYNNRTCKGVDRGADFYRGRGALIFTEAE